MERQFWGFEAPQGGRVWSCETGPGSGIRAYPVFTSEEKARQFAGALFLDEPEMQTNMLSSIRRIEVREISKAARVSLGYLSEVERGQKEASSELLASICSALDLPLSVVLNVVSEKMALHELRAHEHVTALPTVRAMARAAA